MNLDWPPAVNTNHECHNNAPGLNQAESKGERLKKKCTDMPFIFFNKKFHSYSYFLKPNKIGIGLLPEQPKRSHLPLVHMFEYPWNRGPIGDIQKRGITMSVHQNEPMLRKIPIIDQSLYRQTWQWRTMLFSLRIKCKSQCGKSLPSKV